MMIEVRMDRVDVGAAVLCIVQLTKACKGRSNGSAELTMKSSFS